MAIDRAEQERRNKTSRDGGRFLALPHSLMASESYKNLSHPAVRLLLDIGMQFNGENNGQLLCCMKFLLKRGWNSNDTVLRARRELLDSGFLFETRKGARPNKAAWYAVTWLSLHWIPEMDIERKAFERSAYLKKATAKT